MSSSRYSVLPDELLTADIRADTEPDRTADKTTDMTADDGGNMSVDQQ
jgi:hypothetical protein